MSNIRKTVKKDRIKMTPMQSQILVDILYENSEIACGKFPSRLPQEREERLRKWEAVATLLNSKGLGPQKTADQWKKSWHDLKFATRAKASKLELAGGTNLMNEKLSTLEKRVLQLSGDVRIENTEENESKEKLSDELFMKKLEEDLAKTEEDLLKVVKRRNEIVIPKTFTQILEERNKTQKQPPIVENIIATIDEKEQHENEIDAECPASPIMNDDDPAADSVDYNNDSSDDDMKYGDSYANEETADDIILCERISPPPKKRKTSPSVDIASTASSPPKSFIAVFQSQIETQTAVLKEQTSVMKDIAKSLRLIAASLHSS